MLKSFYKYIAEELILGFFKEKSISKGSRFYLIIENDEYREGLLLALKELSSPIVLSDIYEGSGTILEEEYYETYCIEINPTAPKIIIGYDKTATEDYLTTMRNAIGVKDTRFENFGLLYILSDRGLSSIVTASQDLQGSGSALHSQVIVENIQRKVDTRISKDFEAMYIKSYLKRIAEYIEDGTCTLFEFKSVLNVLQKGELKEYFSELGFFYDNRIYENSFNSVQSNEMFSSIETNQELFLRVNNAMTIDDKDYKEKELCKFLDERLMKRIIKSQDWKSEIKYQDILDSKERKYATANLELVNVELSTPSAFVELISSQKGNNKRSSNFIIICDQSNSETQFVKLKFNKSVKFDSLNKDVQLNGSNLIFKVSDRIIKETVGENDNCHDFSFLKMDIRSDFFAGIDGKFTISKRGEIVVNIPEGCETLLFGRGEQKIGLPLNRELRWDDTYTLQIQLEELGEEDKVFFSLILGDRVYKIILKLAASKAIPPMSPDLIFNSIWEGNKTYNGISNNDSNFFKIRFLDSEYPIVSYFREYLNLERQFIDENAFYIIESSNSITGNRLYESADLDLPNDVKDSLSAIYKYYSDKNTVPSLVYINDELELLYIKYWSSVKNQISNISTNRALSKEEHALTKIGVVEGLDKIYLSPFHPIMIAYMLEFKQAYDKDGKQSSLMRLLSPFYLIPYLSFKDIIYRPYCDSSFEKVKNWLCYETVNSKPQERVNNITKEMVKSKMFQFTKHFSYLFQDKDCPIIISSIGFKDDTNIIIGVIEYIKRCRKDNNYQKIEIHEYVTDLMEETFFERLNRLNNIDSILRELQKHHVTIELAGEYTSHEIIHHLFTRVSFYKHLLNKDQEIGYCHIAFYQMDTDGNYINPASDSMRVEMSLRGLISVPSTYSSDNSYDIGFGTKDLQEQNSGYIYPMAICMNNLYANEKNNGANLYHNNTAIIKRYKFSDASFLDEIYRKANWVTFLNPEVDINFFYQQDVYVVHYTDQYTINAKYDSITVTKHVKQYENMLRKPYEKYSLPGFFFSRFNRTMMNYFNCLNGSWMLGIVNKTEDQIREKMSVVASCIAMLRFMRRVSNVIWIPISLEEILRVTGSIGLQLNHIFTKKMLEVKGVLSDDLLMLGLDLSSSEGIKLYMYPVEVKISKNKISSQKGMQQVSQTYSQIKEHLFGELTFIKKIYRTFFASQLLTSAEKLRANGLIEEVTYDQIESCRYDLLNLNYSLEETLPVPEMGHAALVSFLGSASHSIETINDGGIAICHIAFSQVEAFQFVADPENDHLCFLESAEISVTSVLADVTIAKELEFTRPQNGDPDIEIYDQQLENISSEDDSINLPPSIQYQLNTDESRDLVAEPSSQRGVKIHFGSVSNSSREIYFEPNNTKKVSHPNLGIIGTMGTGKTQFARSVIAQLSKEGVHNVNQSPIGVLVFDYKGDYKDKEFLDAANGHPYRSNYPFNPLKLVITDDVVDMNLPAITADRISDSFAKAYGLGLKQQSNIKQVIIATYADAGIFKDPTTWTNTPPTMEQVIEKYFDLYDANDKAYALFDKLRDYTIFTPDSRCCVSLFEWLNCVRVIDLTLYPDDTKKVIVSLILDLFYAEMKQLGASEQVEGYRELRAMLMVDEAHQFMKKDFNSFRNIISEGRMFGVGMILSTQNISDFKSSKEDYSLFILSWVIHHVNSISRSEVSSIFGANDSNSEHYMSYINKAKIFESICKIGSRVESLRDLPFFELIKRDERF